MRRVAQEKHPPVPEALHALAAEGVDADPFERERSRFTQHGTNAGDDAVGLLLDIRIGIPTKLEVDAPDIVGLPMQQHRLVRVEGRVEPEPALGREIGLHLHVGDEEAVAEYLSRYLQPQHAPDRTARPVRRN